MDSAAEKKFTLITGASAGLGKALSEECARRGMHLILVSLPDDNLHEWGRQLQRDHEVEVHCYETDLTQPQEPMALAGWVKERFAVNILINNAGIGGSMLLEEASIQYIDDMLQLNIRALCLLTYEFIPELKRHPKAYILNISSLAAFSPIPYKTVYPASKAFVYSFSRSLRAELRHTSIKITVLNPGPIMTNQNIIDRIHQHGRLGKWTALTPEWTARKAIRCLLRGRSVVIPGVIGKFSFLLMKIIPTYLRIFIFTRLMSQEVKGSEVLEEVRSVESRANRY